MRKKKFFTKLIFIALGAVLLAGLSFFGVQYYIDSSAKDYVVTAGTAPPADAVMVLGALVYPNGTPSDVLADRLLHAYELYKNGKAKKILVSGDHGTKRYDEVNAMKDFLMQKGVPREDIFMDHAGFDTYDSMFRAKSIFMINTLLVSTQAFHMNRALYIARKLGLEAYGYPSSDKEVYHINALRLRESLAKIKAFLDTDILRRKPKFGGESIPIWSNGILTEG